ncbi:MAG TPA: indole-3-glycerol phosphate synthase TrpC [Flavobacteriaceae bacterium]|nr:indole-3-glycerol phosphate synthase TrpC [Flavobacteriaceae bacterium]MCB9214180.1 indole-3-glycerol phosphate synthase TrpC [Alteromonas sp.]HPF12573.1 indole-3-glycerol phosphate synthase TrpC [Flavobacteriaceae bacterium]HQU21187.1 indole-3-glycerol phosphate synthase TrpC [Flavobacteriaceae bacterium]HQU65387.1 indole-3-glycerol phosphate synthase TrpC [Flavobacteriaceae bacterium]
MTILDQINQYKKKEVEAKKNTLPIKVLEQSNHFGRKPLSLVASLQKKEIGIIAEHKRKSPSKSVINDKVALPEVVKVYQNAGASGISILTDTFYFGGSLADLALARAMVPLPILRKDFIIDPYQIIEAKAFGADVILLIAASLSQTEIKEFSALAQSIGLEVLVEIHAELELKKAIHPTVNLIGVNNRNLKTFEVSIEKSIQLSEKIPAEFVKISESGIGTIESITTLQKYGFKGFLMGEHFMKSMQPGAMAQQFIQQLT